MATQINAESSYTIYQKRKYMLLYTFEMLVFAVVAGVCLILYDDILFTCSYEIFCGFVFLGLLSALLVKNYKLMEFDDKSFWTKLTGTVDWDNVDSIELAKFVTYDLILINLKTNIQKQKLDWLNKFQFYMFGGAMFGGVKTLNGRTIQVSLTVTGLKGKEVLEIIRKFKNK